MKKSNPLQRNTHFCSPEGILDSPVEVYKGAQNDGHRVTWTKSAHLGSSKRRKNDHKGCEADCAERLKKKQMCFRGKKKYGPVPAGQSLAWSWRSRTCPKCRLGAQIIKNGPTRVQNPWFGLKIAPEACQDRSVAFRTGPANKLRHKNFKWI